MKTLILMRHAKSDWSGGETDHARPLNARGRQGATALGNWLRTSGHIPDQALVSDATRTRETWARLNLPTQPGFLPILYHANSQKILDVLKAATGETVLLLAHNPDIAEVANRLVVEPPLDDAFNRYPTGATTILGFDIAEWAALTPATGTLIAFQTPRALMG